MKKTRLRVLNIEDSAQDSALLARKLARIGYDLEFKRVDSAASMRAAVQEQEWDIILCDHSMPHFNALAALGILKELNPEIPLIIISGTIGESVAVEAMRAGAHDYLMKDNLARLAPAIERELQEAENHRARRRAEAALRESEDRYRDLVENSQELICTHDLSGKLLSVNPWAARVLGYTPEEMLKRDMRDYLLPEFRSGFDQYLEELKSEGHAQGTMVVQTATGERRIWEYNNTLRTEGVAVPIVRGMAHDVTERKEAERKLKLRESQLAEAQRLASLGSWNWDLETNTLTWSDEHYQILGLDPKSYMPDFQTALITSIHPDDKDLVQTTVESAFKNHQSFDFYYRIIHPERGTRIIHSRGNIVVNRKGEPIRLFGTAQDVTERKEAEERQAQLIAQLEEQRKRLDNIVTSVPGVVWESWQHPNAASQRIDFVSDYVETMLGYKVEEWLAKPNFWLSIMHPVDREETAKAAAADFARGRRTSSQEFRWLSKDGRAIWVQTNAAVIADDENRPVGMRGVTIDISERKRAEEALRESEKRYRLLFANNPLPMWVYDLETLEFLDVNNAAITHYGYSRDEFLSMTIKDIRPQKYVPSLLDHVSQLKSGTGGAGIWQHQKKNGELIDVEITSHQLEFAGTRAVLVLANDVSERVRIQEAQARRAAQVALRADIIAALAERDSTLRSILESCSRALVKYLDAAFARIWTLNQDENALELQASAGIYTHIDGTHARVPVGSLKIGKIAQERRPHITNDIQNDPLLSDVEWARREGMVAFCGYPLVVEDKLVGVMALFARHYMTEDALDSLASVADIISQAIERKRVERALRLSEEQLQQSQKLEAIGILAGGIAHDFNNLLTAITGYSDLTLRRLPEEDPIHRNITEVKKAADRASSLTRQLLAFSRKQVLQPKVLNLNSVVSELEKMLRRLIGEDVQLSVALEPDLGSVKADPGQIEQVLMNLAVNARDAMPHGGKLTIETRNVYLDERYANQHLNVNVGPYVMLAVSDSGIGMDQTTRDHIFEPFFTTKAVGKGTGLGLSTVYGIVNQSGGNIWVYSELGHGTTFKIYLPRVDEGPQEYTRSEETEDIPHGRETILLAEDEDLVRKLAREVLETLGYQVLEATNGGAALLLCERHTEQIHLLITDVVMPEMSGRELSDRLSLLRPDMKVLFMSGYTNNAIVHQGVLEEGAHFIQKPFSPDVLARKVRDVLDGRRGSGPLLADFG